MLLEAAADPLEIGLTQFEQAQPEQAR